MNRHGLGRWLLMAGLLGAGSAGAQDLKAYQALASSLDGAVTARTTSAAEALTRLDAAAGALEQLAPTLQNRQLVAGLQGSLERARGSLARSPAELEAQVLLARGLMRKALYDQTLSLLARAPSNGAAQLRLLADEFGLSGAPAQALGADGANGNLSRVAWRLQREAAREIGAALTAARPTQSPTSYVNLARGMSWFTAVQDASGAESLKVSQFGDALRQLTEGDVGALEASLTDLRRGNTQFLKTLASVPGDQVVKPPPTPAAGATESDIGPNAGAVTPAPAPTPAASTPARPATAGEVYAALGRALTAAGHGDPALAREQLGQAGTALATAPAPLRSTPGYDALVFDLAAAQTRTALRPDDVQGLISTLTTLERRAAGEPVSTLDQVSDGVASGFGGWLRVLVFALLAALGVVPLYLLSLAFGGRNTYWRAIAVGLALLLLPVFLEGLFGLLAALGDLTGIGVLGAASNFTLTQNAYGLPLWALSAALAIALSIYGFRGLCQQFGLLGRRAAPQTEPATAQGLDWDEDL
ncbi:hypothetical protein GCM10010840_13740 [Deinococcus aerolatus]|uniref:Uncharacterized protein n=1 Tax=Deinococcus aerolatus TaxID=522487 RepID=A0ABQ2G5Z0_9DEIO|nr:hypothetical protein [Deinococcus aerolatus]GGL77040.1 hypothetical protein GCM10010840_13740 [Deinococcus aerolatus]